MADVCTLWLCCDFDFTSIAAKCMPTNIAIPSWSNVKHSTWEEPTNGLTNNKLLGYYWQDHWLVLLRWNAKSLSVARRSVAALVWLWCGIVRCITCRVNSTRAFHTTEQLLKAASDEANGSTQTESAVTNVGSQLPLAKCSWMTAMRVSWVFISQSDPCRLNGWHSNSEFWPRGTHADDQTEQAAAVAVHVSVACGPSLQWGLTWRSWAFQQPQWTPSSGSCPDRCWSPGFLCSTCIPSSCPSPVACWQVIWCSPHPAQRHAACGQQLIILTQSDQLAALHQFYQALRG